MNTNNQSNAQQAHIADASEIWGISFFWTKNLKCDEQEIKSVTEKAAHTDEKNSDRNKNSEICF